MEGISLFLQTVEAPFSVISSFVGIAEALVLALAVLALSGNKRIVDQAQADVVAPSIYGVGAVVYCSFGVLCVDIIANVSKAWFLHEPFGSISVIIDIVVMFAIVFIQIRGYAPSFSYSKIPYLLCVLVGVALFVVGKLSFLRLVDGIGGLLLCFAAGLVVALLLYIVYSKAFSFLNKKKKGRDRSGWLVYRHLKRGGESSRQPFKVAMIFVLMFFTFNVAWHAVAATFRVALPSECETVAHDGEEATVETWVNMGFCPVFRIYYEESRDDPYRVDAYYYQCLDADVTSYSWNKSNQVRGIPAITSWRSSWVDDGRDVTFYRADGSIERWQHIDADGVVLKYVEYDVDGEADGFFSLTYDQDNKPTYEETSPEGIPLDEL